MTRWSLSEILALDYDQALWWLMGAVDMQKAINDAN